MNDKELKIGRINAVLYASEEVIRRTSEHGTQLMIKETAYDQIKSIMNGKCPWQEKDNE